MRKERRMHSKRKRPFLKRLFPDSVMLRCVFCVSVFLCIVVLGIQSYHFAQLKMQEHEIKQDMDRLTDEEEILEIREKLEQKKQDLQDPKKLEQKARDELGLVKPGEMPYVK